MTKKRLFPFFLISVFLLGSLGHRLAEPVRVAESPYSLTFFVENVNTLLLHEFPKEGDILCFENTSSTVLKTTHTPHRLYGRHEGVLLSHDSLLFSDVTFTVSAYAHEKNGRLSLGERSFPIGEETVLRGENFSLCARFTGFSAGF